MNIPVRTYAPVPTADYGAQVLEVEQVEGKFGQQLKWTLSLGDVKNIDGDVEFDKTLLYFTPEIATPKNKLGRLAVAAGYDFNGTLSTEDIVGRTVMITVAVVTRDDGTPANTITDVRHDAGGRRSTAQGGAAPSGAEQSIARSPKSAPAGDDADLPF